MVVDFPHKESDGGLSVLMATTRSLSGLGSVVKVASHVGRSTWIDGEVLIPKNLTRLTNLQTRRTACGEADIAALWSRRHDLRCHEHNREWLIKGYEHDQRATVIMAFEAAERARVEAGFAGVMHGVQANVAAAVADRHRRMSLADLDASSQAAFSLVLSLIIREILCDCVAQNNSVDRLLEVWRPKLSFLLEGYRESLVHAVDDQSAFAKVFEALLPDVMSVLHSASDDAPEDHEADQETHERQETMPSQASESSDGDESMLADGQSPEGQNPDEVEMSSQMLGEQEPLKAEPDRDLRDLAKAQWRPLDAGEKPSENYRIFDRSGDRICGAPDMADHDELIQLRRHLDSYDVDSESIVARMALRLQRLLIASQRRYWERDLDEGVIDGSRLARFVANKKHDAIYCRESDIAMPGAAITILLDNSGSMRGRSIVTAAHGADIIAQVMERCGLEVEVLGFTTAEWKGGKPAQHWVQSGRPENPGRLNSLLHVIYKDARSPYRSVRHHWGLMVKEGLLKENIDGEALLWAYERLKRSTKTRRILMVISDGAPIDDATGSANGGDYLSWHLHKVIQSIERQRTIELLAIGIGHDVGRYYRHAVTIDDLDKVSPAMIGELTGLFQGSQNSRLRRMRSTSALSWNESRRG